MNKSAQAALGLICVSAFLGCGGGQPPDNAAKERITTATLSIAAECIAGTPTASPDLKHNVDDLIAEADKAGDATFDLGTFKDTTMPAQLKYRADEMRRDECAPGEERRLRDAAK